MSNKIQALPGAPRSVLCYDRGALQNKRFFPYI